MKILRKPITKLAFKKLHLNHVNFWLVFNDPFDTREIDAFGEKVFQFSIDIELFTDEFGEPSGNFITIS